MANSEGSKQKEVLEGIGNLAVSGYKSIAEEQGLDIRPLTILAGANSSGKSSFMQPLLLLKQTLEAGYDPGPLLLNGPNVKFTSVDQLLSRTVRGEISSVFSIQVRTGDGAQARLEFKRDPRHGVGILKQEIIGPDSVKTTLRPEMSAAEIEPSIPPAVRDILRRSKAEGSEGTWFVGRDKSFLQVRLGRKDEEADKGFLFGPGYGFVARHVRELVHVPALRGNPARTYPVTAVGKNFPGTFEVYVASIIAEWQRSNSRELGLLGQDLEKLGLTWKVTATKIDDTQVELQVGRLTHAARGGAYDLVNLADVGFGVSQTLPVLVALRTAAKGQLVYLEQPEIHLHPRAQSEMSEVLGDAARRGVRVVVETHSNLLLLGIQTLVREGRLPADQVKLHWFKRAPDGSTHVESADVDNEGRFGEWPEDFAQVLLEAEGRYLDASPSRS
jgi:predicted ATPase